MCNFCSSSIKLASTQEFEGHLAEEHRLEMFECLVEKCGTLESKAQWLLSHLSYTHSMPLRTEDLEKLAAVGKVRLPLGLASCKCKVCKRIFCGTEAKNHLAAHMKASHKKTKEKCGPFHCRLCDVQVAGDPQMLQHAKAHKEAVAQMSKEEREKSITEGEVAESPSYVPPGSSPTYIAPGSREDGEVLSQDDEIEEIVIQPGERSKSSVEGHSRSQSKQLSTRRKSGGSQLSSSSRSRSPRVMSRSSRYRSRSRSRDRSSRSRGGRHRRSSSSRRSRSSSRRRSRSRNRYPRRRNDERKDYVEEHWSSSESTERSRREGLERRRQANLNFGRNVFGQSSPPPPPRAASKRKSYFCQVCNVSSQSREMHNKHERSRKHLENSGREEDEFSVAAGSEDNRGDGLYDRMGRRTSDASDIVIIEDQSAKISEKKRGAASSVEEEEEKMEQEEKKGDCTDCLKPMGDAEEHISKNHRDLFISCKLCLQVNILTFSLFFSTFEKSYLLPTGWLFSLSGSVLG